MWLLNLLDLRLLKCHNISYSNLGQMSLNMWRFKLWESFVGIKKKHSVIDQLKYKSNKE